MDQISVNPSNALVTLAVDTSTARAGFAMARGNQLLASLVSSAQEPHSRSFFRHLNTLFELAGCQLSDVDIFAAATGPGSFTGLRVGLAAFSGFAHTTRKPVIGMSSIDAFALTLGVTGRVLVVLDAGRNEVYCGMRLITTSGAMISLCEDWVVGQDGILSHALFPQDSSLILIGDGALKHRESFVALANQFGRDLQVVTCLDAACSDWQLKASVPPIAETIALHAVQRFQAGMQTGLRPHYIRPSDAEINYAKR